MEITIAHYRNIEKLGITIADGKVNYLFGICGSGKKLCLRCHIQAGGTGGCNDWC